jgi:maltose alpha-D-glucosyltransferase/alpha-amylase
MVSGEERDYMYLAYSADPRMRINIGIRRRLAPLVDNNRRRIELLNSLLFSFPGTPILYYGDELGMGDNIYLGDRNGVRTPMQWSSDRNAGFSRAVPAKLFSPVVMDPVWGYEAINVEAQQSDPSSLLSWMRNMIALRKLFQVFGRGTLKFLNPSNRKILAYVREYKDEKVLCVANLSRFAQPVELDLEDYAGMTPVEMLGYVEFPQIGKKYGRAFYPLTLAPYGFLWLELQARQPEENPARDDLEIFVNDETDWQNVVHGSGRRELEETILTGFLATQRWFAGKSRQVIAVEIADTAVVDDGRCAITLIEVSYSSGSPEIYALPLRMAFATSAEEIQEKHSSAILVRVSSVDEQGVLCDGLFREDTPRMLVDWISESRQVISEHGVFQGIPGRALSFLHPAGEPPLAARVLSGEQSNSSVLIGEKLILKLFRRPASGPNPDVEINRHLSEHTDFSNIPPFCGSIEYKHEGQQPSTFVMLQGFVENEGDGWQWTLDELDRYFEATAPQVLALEELPEVHFDVMLMSEADVSPLIQEQAGIYLKNSFLLGSRTAEMHLALAQDAGNPAFTPEPFLAQDLESLRDSLIAQCGTVFELLKEVLPRLPDNAVQLAGLALSRRRLLQEQIARLADGGMVSMRTRIHGDYHLGQVLQVKGDFVILDFEGEPARTLEERRAKHSPLKDVAGMLRSFSYASSSALMKYLTRRPEDLSRQEPWAKLWEQAVSAEFLRGYRRRVEGSGIIPRERDQFQRLLQLYLLEKAFYELKYELDSRPNWVQIPLTGILALQE